MLILAFVFPSLHSMVTVMIEFAILALMIAGYSCFVGGMDEHTAKTNKMLVRVALYEFALFITGLPMWKLARRVGSSSIMGAAFVVSVMALLLLTVFLFSETGKKCMNTIDSGFTMNAFSDTEELHPGDLIIAKDKEKVEQHAKNVLAILPAKDRFLHMLILGPTGCGKTSQSILPMVNQDMQNPNWGITVLEPKGDLAIKAAMMAKHYGREVVYFDPSFKNCPKFNPLAGSEIDVVENIATTFKMLNPDSPQFFLDLNEQLIRNAVKVLKRLDKAENTEGKFATLINLSRLLQNSGSQGREFVNNLSTVTSSTETEAKENADIVSWFLNDYFPERSKVYENTSGVRSQVSKLVSNEYLREVLNPDWAHGEKNEVNFDKHLAEGGVICISTAQGVLRDLSRYLGYFIILSLQSAVFRRPGNENTRRPHSLYIDEFQTYSTPGFADMLTQGRSYRVSSILATQARAQMAMGGGKDGKNFVELVSSNARNVILYPGINVDDANYYSKQFGEYEETEIVTSTSHKKFNLLTGGFDKLGHPTESSREQKTMKPYFSPTELIFGKEPGYGFGKITYCLIKNNSPQLARVGVISYIPKDLNDELDEMIAQYTAEYARESAAEYYQHEGEAQQAAAEDELVFHSLDSSLNDLADDATQSQENHEVASPSPVAVSSSANSGEVEDIADNTPIDFDMDEFM